MMKQNFAANYSHISDLGEIVTGSINFNTMSSAERINFIQNQPSPDDVAKIKTDRAQTKRTGDHKKTLKFQYSWMNQFTWLSFCKLLNGDLCKFSCFLRQMSCIKIHLLHNLSLLIRCPWKIICPLF